MVGTGTIEGNLAPILRVSPSTFVNDLPLIWKQFTDKMKTSGCSRDVLTTFKEVISRYVLPRYLDNDPIVALLYDLASTYSDEGDRFETDMLMFNLVFNLHEPDLRYALSEYIYQHAHNIEEGLYDYPTCDGFVAVTNAKCTREYINNTWYYSIYADVGISNSGRGKDGYVKVYSKNNIGFITPSYSVHPGKDFAVYFRLCKYSDSTGTYLGISPESVKIVSCDNCTVKQYGKDFAIISPLSIGRVSFDVMVTDPSGRQYRSRLPIYISAISKSGVSVSPKSVNVHAGENFTLTVSGGEYIVKSVRIEVYRGDRVNILTAPVKVASVNGNSITLNINSPGEYTINVCGYSEPDEHSMIGCQHVHVTVTHRAAPGPSPSPGPTPRPSPAPTPGPSPHPQPPSEEEGKVNPLILGAALLIGAKLIH